VYWHEKSLEALNLIKIKKIEEAIDIFKKIFQDEEVNEAWPFLKYADLIDDQEKKIEIYRKANDVEPNPYSCLKLIEIYLNNFNYIEASEWLKALIKIDYNNVYIEYYINLIKPKNFNSKEYLMLNADLGELENDDSIKIKDIFSRKRKMSLLHHYVLYGIKEKRNYKLSININSSPNFSPLFINHDISLTGAPVFLYDFVTYLKNNNIIKNPIIIESFKNNLFDNYDIQKMYHENSPEKLLQIIKETNPVFIYSNSLNLYYYNIDKFIDYWHKTYFHFHETLSNLDENILKKIKNQKIFVVANRIKKELKSCGCTNVQKFPPFIHQEKIFHIKNNEYNELNKLTIGMSGNICDRKNLKLFYKLAESCPQYEFIWIGGENWADNYESLYGYKPLNLPNFTHVPYVKNPYVYYKNLDYFFLTSKNDPCPIVVLENLLINKRVITIKDNIFYKHNKSILQENLIEIKEKEEEKIIEAFQSLDLKKYKADNAGENYIKKYFSKPKILKKSRSTSDNNFLIFNFYRPGGSYKETDINYFVNLINNFNLHNKFSYKVFINVNLDNGFEEKISDEKEKFFNKKYQKSFKDIINLKEIQISPNKGWDLNGLLVFIKNIYDNNHIDESQKLAYLHNKSNILWRDELNKIFYLKNHEIKPHDTIVCNKFFIECPANDLNRTVMKNYNLFNDLSEMKFNYIQGTVFITKLHMLKNLYDFNYELKSNLTTLSTKNSYWIECMKSDDIFNYYYKYYSNNIYNQPIDLESKEMVEKGLANNFLDLYHKFNKKGIPDLHFEHALERYIGYLISQNRKIHTV
jgi:hypothetical protein